MNRRQFLGSSGLTLVVSLAGCSTLRSQTREGVILTHIELGNASSESQVFDVVVSYNDEFIHWASYEVEASVSGGEMGGTVIEVDSPAEPGNVEVSVRVGEIWERTDFDTDEYDEKQVIAIATYGRPDDGELRMSRIVSDRPISANE